MSRAEPYHPPDEELDALTQGELPESDAVRVADHVRTCKKCQVKVEDLSWVKKALDAAVEGCPSWETLRRYITGDLSEEDEIAARRVETHVLKCPMCSEKLQLFELGIQDTSAPSLTEAIVQHLEHNKIPSFLLAADSSGTLYGILVDRARGLRESFTATIRSGPEVTPEGRLRIVVDLPHEERLRARPSEVNILIQDRQYPLATRTQEYVVVVDHLLDRPLELGKDASIWVRRLLSPLITVTVYVT
jgi:hypothetical protein